MNSSRDRKIRLIVFGTIFFLSFFCKGAAFMPIVHASMPMSAAMQHEEHGSCCSEQASAVVNNHHDVVFTLPGALDLFVFGSTLAQFFVLASFVSLSLIRVSLYVRSVRLRFGAPSVFDFFTSLFRIGILHPKIW